MKFCDERIQKHLLKGGKVKRPIFNSPIYYNDFNVVFDYNNNKFDYNNNTKVYCLKKSDLTADDWEIVEPEYDWDKIIEDKILCEFSDDNDYKDDEKVISILTSIDEYRGFYYNSQGFRYKYCKPFNPSEYINIDDNLKEYKK